LISGSGATLALSTRDHPATTREETNVNDQNGRFARLRHTAIGALTALAAVGAIAGTAALAAKPRANPQGHPAAAKTAATTAPGPAKTPTPQPSSPEPFLAAAQRLVDDGTITAAEGQALDREIRATRIDTETLASGGFTQIQLQAVEQALGNTKRALAQEAQ
jgi:uncharacterized membrane protein YebE (DUF533 family)